MVGRMLGTNKKQTREKTTTLNECLAHLEETEELLDKDMHMDEKIKKTKDALSEVKSRLNLLKNEDINWAIGVIIYLFTVMIILAYAGFHFYTEPKFLKMIPLYVFIWGGVGACVYLMYACYTHIAARDFDHYYVPWYLMRPIMGSILAAAVYLIFVSVPDVIGLNASGSSVEENGRYMLSLISFLAGFSVRFSFNALERTIEKLLPFTQDVKEGEKKDNK